MPSVITKTDKSQEVLDPSKQIANYVDNKVRNLEKRKLKLDAYRSDSQAGKQLNADQKLAVTKYDCVIESLEILKDMQKQFALILQEHSKIAKKLAKKEMLEKQQQDIKRTGEILSIKKLLSLLISHEVLEQFSDGLNGALKLSDEQLKWITELGKLVFPETSILDFEEKEIQAGEHLYSLIEGKNKEILGTTYKNLRDLLQDIKECSYFKPNPVEEVSLEAGDAPLEDDEPTEETQQISTSPILSEQGHAEPGNDHNGEIHNVNQIPLMVPTSVPIMPIPTPQVIPLQPQSLTDVLPVTGNFNFLQESQIERNAHVDPAIVAAHSVVPPNPAILGYPGPNSQYLPPNLTPIDVSSKAPNTQETSVTPPQNQVKQATEMVASEFDPARPIQTQTFTNQNFAIHPMIPQPIPPMMGGLMPPLSHVIPVGIMATHQGVAPNAPVVSVADTIQQPSQTPSEQQDKLFTPPIITKETTPESQEFKNDEGQQPNSNDRNSFSNSNGRSNGGPRQNGGGPRGGRGGTMNGFQKGTRPNRGAHQGYYSNYNGNREGYTGYNNGNNNFRRGTNTSRGSNRGGSNNIRGGASRNNVRAQTAQQ